MRILTACLCAVGLLGAERTPVVVELFTSEGCSSCPPADLLLTRLSEKQSIVGVEIIALSEHVDYWNRLGWRDPFSSAELTARQQRYAEVFGTDRVYTPQMVVDGRTEFVGSDAARADRVIADAARQPKAAVRLSLAQGRLQIRVAPLPRRGVSADVLLAITENSLESNVSRGENAGRRLRHIAVVRRLIQLAHVCVLAS